MRYARFSPVILAASLFATSPARAATPPPPIAEKTLTADFAERDRLPESDLPTGKWYRSKMMGTWGPHAVVYPTVAPPAGCDPVAWKRARIIAVAQHYLGLPYQHHHIPAWTPPASWTSRLGGPESAGIDCSNFTAWVYNYGLGVKFTGAIEDQADGPGAPGRRLAHGEPLAAGDLLFILEQDRSRVSHVVIYVDEQHIIDSHGGGVRVRPFAGWYQSHLSHARRIIE